MRTYAIGDIHGQLEGLKAAHAQIAADRARTGDTDSPVIHLGDYLDRGPDSAGVVQFILDGIAAGEPWQAILGNHDLFLLNFLDHETIHSKHIPPELTWLNPRLGGNVALASYGVTAVDGEPLGPILEETRAKVPADHINFFRDLPLYIERGGMVFVHAGIRPGVPLTEQTMDDLLEIRPGFLDDGTDHGALIVHGHTAVVEATHYGNRVDLDTGAGYGAPITVAVFEDGECEILTDTGRKPINRAPVPTSVPVPEDYKKNVRDKKK